MVIETLLMIFVVFLGGKICACFRNLSIVRKFLQGRSLLRRVPEEEVEMLLLIPVLREQNVIVKTLEYFSTLPRKNIRLHLCIAGTRREAAQGAPGTGAVIDAWMRTAAAARDNGLSLYYCEADDPEGDRASQLNHAVRFMRRFCSPQLIGVYDADSMPEPTSLEEAACRYLDSRETVWQQPASFIKAANRLAAAGASPVLVANALYQSVWTMIRELPRWISHHASHGKRPFWRNDYLIGHGQYLPFPVYEKFAFPEGEVTDGIQLGYRLTGSAHDIAPLRSFCNDDVPHQVTQLISQHKRWFGGCMRLGAAHGWCRREMGKSSLGSVLDGLYSQISWAVAAPATVLAVAAALFAIMSGRGVVLPFFLLLLFLLYVWFIPFLALRLFPEPLRIRRVDWLALPLAMGLKCLGPLLYVFQSLLSCFSKKKIRYSKVER